MDGYNWCIVCLLLIIELNPELPTSQKLKTWFAKVHAEYVDLISQLGGSSGTFLIHAESLILRFALDENYRSDFQESRQFLRLIFHIECFLQSIQYCGGSFRLVFFDNFKRLLQIYSPALWALRQCMLLVCQVTILLYIHHSLYISFVSHFSYFRPERQAPATLIMLFSSPGLRQNLLIISLSGNHHSS